MQARSDTNSVFCLCVPILLALVVPALAQQKDECDCGGKTPPNELAGKLGPGGDYYFTHRSDVDDDRDGRYLVCHSISNLHDALNLPTQWKAAEIPFVKIAPGKCFINSYTTGATMKPDDDAKLDYGPAAQNHKSAPAYVKAQAPPAIAAAETRELQSRLAGVVLPRKGEGNAGSVRINLTFRVSFNDGRLVFQVQNDSDSALQFRIPQLSRFLSSLPADDVRTRWEQNDDRFVVAKGAKEPSVLSVNYPADGRLNEQRIGITLFNADGEELLDTAVTAYLPPARRR